MALVDSFEKSGNYLFRHRGQIPVFLFLAAIPVIYITDISEMRDAFRATLVLLAILISVTGFCIRAIAIGTTPKGTSGRNTESQVAESLNQTGIYSIVRHPLYLGNYLMWIGIVIFCFNFYFIVIVSLAFWLYYERIMFAEERFLERKFGTPYQNWANKVPAFLPDFRKYRKSEMPFSYKSILRREYSGILACTFGFLFIDYLRLYFTEQKINVFRISSIALGIAIILTLVLRTLKHNTELLNEGDRS